MKKYYFSTILTVLMLVTLCCACQSGNGVASQNTVSTQTIIDLSGDSASVNATDDTAIAYEEQTFTLSGNLTETFSVPDQNDSYVEETATKISISGNQVDVVGSGVSVQGSQIIISEEGTYILSGTLEEGQVYIHADEKAKVQLVLDNVSLHCSTSAPLFVDTADKVILTLPETSVNTMTDGAAYLDDAANGCIFSRCDLSINGSGTLNVTGNYNNAISCKDDLKIANGTLNLTAVNNALKGNDSVSILSGTITIESQDDGIKVDNDKDTDKGFILIVDGTVNITADSNCFQSPRAVVLLGGNVLARSFEAIVNCDGYEIGTTDYITEWI